VRRCLKAHSIQGEVWQDGQRIYLETEQVAEAVEAVRRVFGLVSLSPVDVVAPDLHTIEHAAVALARRIGLNDTRSFRVQTNRADKSFPAISPEIDRRVGAAIVEATDARVDLSRWAQADERRPVEIGIEIQSTRRFGLWRDSCWSGWAAPGQPGTGSPAHVERHRLAGGRLADDETRL